MKFYRLFFFIALTAFFSDALASPTARVISPSDANYISGNTAIVFGAQDANSLADLEARIYYSLTTGTFTNIIAQNFDLNAETCNSTNFSTEATCSLKWETSAIADGNYFIDLNVVNLAENSGGTDSSNNSFQIDKTAPTISNLSPATSTLASSKIVSFNLTDNGSGTKLSSARIDINSTTSTVFAPSTHCQLSGTTYSCSYTETRFDTNGTDYNVTVFATDNSENSAVQAFSVFKYIASPPQVSGLTATAGNSQVSLSWSAVNLSDLNNYNVFIGTSSGFATDSTTLTATVPAGTNSYSKTGLTNGTQYFFKVSAKDKSANEGPDSEEKNATPTASASGLNTPTINSSTHTHDTWSTNNDPAFSWGEISGATYYSHAFDQTQGTEPTENKGTALSFNPDGTQTDGVWYFHLRACNSSSQCSSTSHFKAKIDKSGPTQPIELSLTANPNGTVDITWNASSERPEGENSGIKEYRIYRRLNDDTPDDSDVVGTVTTTSFTDNDTALNNGVRYYYWVRAFDNAGNSGTISGVRSILVTKTTSCAINFTSSIEQFIKTGEAKVKISSSTAMQDAELTAKILGGQTIQQQETDYQNTFVEATLNINQSFDERTLELTLSAQDSSGRECFYRKTLQIDGSAPEIEWTKPLDGTNIDMSLPLNISVTATDQKSGVEKVVFYFKQKGLTTKIGEDSEPTGSEYSVNFSPQGLKKGEIELLAEAFDGAGNKKETKISANVSKIPIEETVYDRTEYSFRLSELDSLLKQTGLKEELAIEAKNFLQNNSVSREFIVTQLEEEYFAKILVEFFNNSNEKLDIKIVEIVPKAFAQNAALISSEKNFEIILDDPVIEFTFLQVEPGEKIELEYSLKNPLTKQEADELIEKKPSEQFSSPPIILNSSTNTKDGFSTKGIPPSLILILLAVIIIAFIVFVALAAFGGGLILHLHKKANEAPLAREAKAIKRSPGPMEQASDQLKNWFAQKDIEEQKGKRFKWKGS